MGFNLNKAKAAKEEILKSFTPLELNEAMYRPSSTGCVSKDYSSEKLFSDIFVPRSELRTVFFYKNNILQNKQSIQYLFGQLAGVHEGKQILTIDEFFKKYTGEQWTSDKSILMNFLYLGRCNKINCILPFNKKNNSAIIEQAIKPTLSPKDPNFPAWWEEHKSEWEEPKKEGKEPSDD